MYVSCNMVTKAVAMLFVVDDDVDVTIPTVLDLYTDIYIIIYIYTTRVILGVLDMLLESSVEIV